MLERLSIKNYALIEDLHVDFAEGFNVLTGETGAGKSIIIGALGLILGDRAQSSIIRKGSDSCVIKASFAVRDNKPLHRLLKEQGISVGEDSLLLSREISHNGKNKCLANDQLITLGMLESIGGLLVDLHGQHEHQAILLPREQLNILDDFGGLLELREKMTAAYEEYSGLKREYNDLLNSDKERAHFIDLYQFQAKEIRDAHLQENEDEELDKEIKLLNNAEKIFGLANEVYQSLYDQENSVLSQLTKSKHHLQLLQEYDEDLKPCLALLAEGIVDLEEVNNAVRNYKEKISFDPARLDKLIERKEMISRLKSKYGATVKDIINYREKIEKELSKLTNLAENREALTGKIEVSLKKALRIALQLAESRRQQATKLEHKSEQELKDLGLPKLKFKVSLVPEVDENKEPLIGPTGTEKIEFLISPNLGEELQPLSRIASGGEMSRIMLALKTVLASGDKIPVLIFDEIDTGIGGNMAEVVGRKMSALSRRHQIICVTHWPQIAGLADYHLQVSKEAKNDRTVTQIRKLGPKDRVTELARMLGGETLTGISLKHAAELLKQAPSHKS